MYKHAATNRFYRLIWSHVHACWVAVAEGARGRGKGGHGARARRLLVAAMAGSSFSVAAHATPTVLANALPRGAQVVAGQATVATSGNRMTVTQGSAKAILNWQQFNIGADSTVRFDQPSASAVALNRVVGSDASQVFGKLSSNGTVFLVNPQGVLFGAGSQVDVGGLVASSLALPDHAFMSGDYAFAGAAGAGAVRNEGSIRSADGGVVALLAPVVSNSGAIAAPNGNVALAAGDQVGLDLSGDGLVSVRVSRGALAALVENSGAIAADGGKVLLTAQGMGAAARSSVNNTGVVQARGLVAEGGSIRLVGDGDVHAGALDASSVAGAGGHVAVSGNFVALDGAINADGATGGDIAVDAALALSSAAASSARGAAGSGGKIAYRAGGALVENTSGATDVTGATDGGAVSLHAGGGVISSGAHTARGTAGNGGRIDVSGADVRLLGARLDASGVGQGGMVRVGGAFQGGAQHTGAPDAGRFVGRWGQLAGIANASKVFINDNSSIDVSARGAYGQGGTAVVWSDAQTTMLGKLKATGAAAGGAVEISSRDELRHVGLGQLDIGAGGQLLLDPKNITIGDYPFAWTYQAILGRGYSGGNNASVTGLDAGDGFGFGVALNAAGDRLAVGAPFDAGSSGAGNSTGAVRLFSFSDSNFSGATLQATLGAGYTGGKNVDVALADGDRFGAAVALDANAQTLAVGAVGDNGGAGAVRMFTFADSLFGGAVNSANIGSGYGSANLGNASAFGTSVALNGNGGRLAAGSLYDSGAGGSCANCGAVYLFNTPSASPSFVKAIGSGYGVNLPLAADARFGASVALDSVGDSLAIGAIGTNNGKGEVYLYRTPFGSPSLIGNVGQGGTSLSVPLNDNELFGSAVAFNASGSRLAVGAPRSAGFGSVGTGPGSVRIIDFGGGNLTGANVSATLGRDYTVGANADVPLNNIDRFGFSVALNGAGDRLVAGAPYSSSADGNTAMAGSVHAFGLLPATAGNLAFASKPALDATVHAGALSALLDGGTSVTLQANNDLTLAANNPLSSSGAGNGSLTLQAGRSIAINSNITTGDADLTLLANATTAQGVVSANRDAGSAVITVAAGTTIDAGSGNVNMTIANGAGKTHTASGALTVNGRVSANSVVLKNQGTGTGDVIIINPGARVIGTGSGTSIEIAAATGAGGFSNRAGASGLSAAGRYLVYSNNPGSTLEGVSGYNKRYSQSYTGTTPSYASSGNWFLYSITHTLTVTAIAGSKVYDGAVPANSALGYTVTGFIDGDTMAGAFSGELQLTAPSKNVGAYTIARGTLASNLGYAINYNSRVFNITPRPLNVSATGVNRVYDGTIAAGVTLADDRISGDNVVLGYSSSLFADKHAGVDKQIVVSDLSKSGADANNYTLASTTATTTATITPRVLTASATGINKVYDGGTSASVTLGDNRVAGDLLTLSSAGAAFADKNAGTGKQVTVTGIAMDGTDAANYTLAATTATATAAITPRTLTATATSAGKVYDGGTAAPVTLGDDRVNGDVLTLSNASAVFADKNVGANKAITVSGIAVSGVDAANYTLASSTATGTGTITARTLNASASGIDKVYDGTPAASVSFSDDRISGDVLAYTGNAAFADKNAGAGKAVTVTGIALSGLDAGNYTLGATTAATTAAITPRTLTASATGADKTYDGTTAASVTLGDNRINGDVLALSNAGAAFADKNVGTNKAITVSGIALSGADAANYVLASSSATGYADIAPRTLNVSAAGLSKVYDGTASASVSFSDDRIGGDVLGYSATTTMGDKNVGHGKAVTVTGIALTGLDAANYTLASTTATTTTTVTPRVLTASATGINKVYDGGTSASVTLGDNRVAGDLLTLSSAGAAFADKNAGTGKQITVTGIAMDGADATNYTLAATTATATAAITPRLLTFGATGVDRGYDGTTVAGVTFSDNRVTNDILSLAGSAAFADKNVGIGKPVTVSGITLSGADAHNYTLASSGASTTATIVPRVVTVTLTGADKVYDGTAAATAALADDRIGGDILQISAAGAAFADKNAGTKTVTASGLALGGADAANYTLASGTATGTATISPRALDVSATAADKIYDGTTKAEVVLTANPLAGDTVGVTGSGAFADKHAGAGKQVIVWNFMLSGADAGNYTVPAGSVMASANIARRVLEVSASAQDKIYDGSTAASVSFSDNRLRGDLLVVGSRGASFADPNAGQSKTVTLHGLSLDGADAGNYTLASSSASMSASILPKALTATLAGTTTKVYDGTTAATIGAGDVLLSGFAAGESAGVTKATGHFNSANVADASSVTASFSADDFTTAGGTQLSNYILPASVTGAGVITPKTVSIGGVVAAPKVYDGTTGATLADIGSLSGLVGGETLTLTGPTRVSFDTRGAGSGKLVTASGYGLADGSGRASNYLLASTSASANNGVINKAVLTVRADDKARNAGAENPVLTFSLDGLVASDVGKVTPAVQLGTDATAQSPAGSYAIRASGGTLDDYRIDYVGGTLTVTGAPQRIAPVISAIVAPAVAQPASAASAAVERAPEAAPVAAADIVAGPVLAGADGVAPEVSASPTTAIMLPGGTQVFIRNGGMHTTEQLE